MSGSLRLCVRKLSVWLGERSLCPEVSFELAAGATHVLLGPSGAGKSTALAAILGLLPEPLVAKGCVEFLRADSKEPIRWLELSPRARRAALGPGMTAVFQDPASALHPLWSVEKNLRAALSRIGVRGRAARDRGLSELRALGFAIPESVWRARPAELSGGERQRVTLSMALCLKPELLVLDEPTAMLDASRREELANLLLDLQSGRPLSLLVATHDLALAKRLGASASLLHGRGREPEFLPAAELAAGSSPRLIEFHPPWQSAVECAGPLAEPRRTGTPDLALKGVSVDRKSRGRRFHLEAVDLELRPGQRIAVVGPSGAGKSTLARAGLALFFRIEGEVFWFGERVRPGREQRRRLLCHRVQPVFQDPRGSLDPRLTVRQILEEVRRSARARGTPRLWSLEEVLAAVRLGPEFLARFPATLSGGEAQRVAFARALLAEPETLVLDEAFSSLDRRVAVDLFSDVLRGPLGQRTSMLLIAHDLELAFAVADEVLVMDRGRIVERGRPEQLRQGAAHPLTRALLASGGMAPRGGHESPCDDP